MMPNLTQMMHLVRMLPYGRILRANHLGLLRRLWTVYRRQGMPGLGRLLRRSTLTATSVAGKAHAKPSFDDYGKWLVRHDTLVPADTARIMAALRGKADLPRVSVLLAVESGYAMPHLDDAIRAVRAQLYPHWELCIAAGNGVPDDMRDRLQRAVADEARISIVTLPNAGNMAQLRNAALALATGEFVVPLSHDMLLRAHALFLMTRLLADNPGCSMLYADEDSIDPAGQRHDPYFKCDWNPELFYSHDFFNGAGVYRASLVRRLDGWRGEYAAACDYDLALRCARQSSAEQILHLPRILAHRWNDAVAPAHQRTATREALRRALDDHFTRTGIDARCEMLANGMQRPRFAAPDPAPLISLIIPTRNGLQLIRQCIDSIVGKTTYPNYEILVVDNGSDDPDTLAYFRSLQGEARIRVLRDERPFNYSALNNAAVRHARGEYIGLVNNDIVVIAPDWLDEMLGLAAQAAVGAVGARLWYADDTLQHAGVVTGIFGIAGHVHRFLPKGEPGYRARAELTQAVSVVTAACLLVRKQVYVEIGGLDEDHLQVAFNDVDFCLRLCEAGYRNVWTPYAELYHLESATRGLDDTAEKKRRFQAEVDYMERRWGHRLENDPAYNPNLTLESEHFELAWPPRVPSISG